MDRVYEDEKLELYSPALNWLEDNDEVETQEWLGQWLWIPDGPGCTDSSWFKPQSLNWAGRRSISSSSSSSSEESTLPSPLSLSGDFKVSAMCLTFSGHWSAADTWW